MSTQGRAWHALPRPGRFRAVEPRPPGPNTGPGRKTPRPEGPEPDRAWPSRARLAHFRAETGVRRTRTTELSPAARRARAGQPTVVPPSRLAGTCWLFFSALKSCRAWL